MTGEQAPYVPEPETKPRHEPGPNRHQKRASRRAFLLGQKAKREQVYREWCAIRRHEGKGTARADFERELQAALREREA